MKHVIVRSKSDAIILFASVLKAKKKLGRRRNPVVPARRRQKYR